MERRRAIVYINEHELAAILRLPPGLRAVAVAPDFLRSAIAVIIEGDSLEETPAGTELPEYQSVMGGRWLPSWKDWSDGYREGLAAGRAESGDNLPRSTDT